MTALLMALILCVGMVSGTNKEVRAQSASQNSEMQAASESDVTTENTANIAEIQQKVQQLSHITNTRQKK